MPHFKGCSKIIVIIVSTLLVFIAVEAISRFFLWQSRQPYGPKIHDYSYFDSNGIFRIKPNSKGWHIGYDDEPIKVTVNSDGFRGPDLRTSPSQRIIFTGDSIVFSAGVPQENTFTALLEDRFQKEGQDVEVINAGTTDIGVDQYLKQAQHNLFDSYKPDLVVIGLYLNDSRPPQGFLGESQDKIVLFLNHSPMKHLALTHYVRKSYIIFQVKRNKQFSQRFNWTPRYNSNRWKNDPAEARQTVIEAKFDWGAAWNSSFVKTVYPALTEIQDIYLRNRVKFAVVLFPVSLQVYTNLTDPFIDYPQRQLSMVANKSNIPFLDLLPALKKYREFSLFADHVHLNSAGSLIVANSIFPFLQGILANNTEKKTP